MSFLHIYAVYFLTKKKICSYAVTDVSLLSNIFLFILFHIDKLRNALVCVRLCAGT